MLDEGIHSLSVLCQRQELADNFVWLSLRHWDRLLAFIKTDNDTGIV
jgi:hypothetical protein